MSNHSKHRLITLAIAASSIGCAAEDVALSIEEPSERSESLLSGGGFNPTLAPPAWLTALGASQSPPINYSNCSGYIDPATGAPRLDLQLVLADVVIRARYAASSFAMLDCLTQVMVNGGVIYPEDPGSVPTVSGPYCRPNDALFGGCFANTAQTYNIATNADPYNLFEFSRLSNTAVRVAQARRLWMQGQTNAPITIACHDNPNASSPDDFPNGPRGAIVISDYNGDAITLGKHEFEGALAALAEGGDAAVAYRAYLAGLIWHEVLHGHGYDHGPADADDLGTPVFDPVSAKQAPHTYGACLQQVMLDSSNITGISSCGGTTCPTGTLQNSEVFRRRTGNPAVDQATGCTCIPDSGTFTAARTQTAQPVPAGHSTPQIVFDSAGAMYRRRVDNVGAGFIEVFRPSGWQTIFSSTPDEIYAGGDKVFYRKAGALFRRDGTAWTRLGTVTTQVAVDDVGRAFTVSAGTVFSVRPGTAEPEVDNYGGPPSGASAIFVGGNKLYARNPSGNLYEYNSNSGYDGSRPPGSWAQISGPANSFAVDAFGVVYRLNTDLKSVWAFRNNQWVQLRQETTLNITGIVAGQRLFARTSNGHVHELFPNDQWRDIRTTTSFETWAARGQRLALREAGAWSDYTNRGTYTDALTP